MKLCCVNCGCEIDTSPKVGALNHWHFYSLYILSLVEALSPQTLHWARKRFGTNQSPCTPYKVHNGRSLSVEKKRQGNGLIFLVSYETNRQFQRRYTTCVWDRLRGGETAAKFLDIRNLTRSI